MILYTFKCKGTGETQDVIVCELHANEMPSVDGESVFAKAADDDCICEFCELKKRRSRE